MNGETFAVVTTDGREHPAVDLDTIKRWYLEKHLNDNSLIFSSEAGDWRLLGRTFDINSWTGNSARSADAFRNEDVLTHIPENPEANYFEEITSLAVPPDADFRTVQHFTPHAHSTISKPKKKGIPGLTALATLAVFGVFAGVAYVVLTTFVFYEETVSFSNNHEIAALKTHVMGKPFSDPSGVKINLPAGWNMVSPKMPEARVQAPEAKMFGVNFDKKMFSALEILPVDEARLDLKAKMSQILQKYRGNSTGPFSVIADHDTQMGSNMARKSIFSRRDKSVDASTTTHLIISQDQKNLYVYQIWTATDKYSSVLTDFDEAERAINLP